MSHPNRPAIYLEAGNPLELTVDELQVLADEIRSVAPDCEPLISVRDEGGYGTAFPEVLHVYMEIGEFAGATAAVIAPFWTAVSWMRRRWIREHQAHPETTRPRRVTLLGPDGRVLKEIRIEEPEGEPIEPVSTDDRHPIPWPPSRKGD